MRQIFLAGSDVTEHVLEIPTAGYESGDFGQLIYNPINSLTGDLTRGFWDVNKPSSPFYGASDITDYPIQIYNDGVLAFDGFIQSINANYGDKKAQVGLKTKLQKTLEGKLVYISATQDNPARIVQEICNLYKIDIDTASFSASSGIYNTDNVVINVRFPSADCSILDALQQIANVGVARIFDKGNKMAFEVWKKRTTHAIISFSDEHSESEIGIIKSPEISPMEKQKSKGYRVTWASTASLLSPVIYGAEKDRGISIDGGIDSPVRIMSAQSAVWIGLRWIEYLNTQQFKIRFSVPIRYGKSLDLGMPISLTYRGTTFNLDVVSVNNVSTVESEIIGVSR